MSPEQDALDPNDETTPLGTPLLASRVVPVRREGNRVYVRTLRYGEEDTGESVKLREGDRITFEAGALEIDTRQIDAIATKGLGGYAPVANTVWTWYSIIPDQLQFIFFFFSLARRLDATHTLWSQAIRERESAKEDDAMPQRIGFLNTMATAEVTIIALNRVIMMVESLTEKYCPDLEVPDSVRKIQETVRQMRNAFEHIDERAEGKADKNTSVQDAVSIFFQPEFIPFCRLRYKEYTLDFNEDAIRALLDCRELVMKAIDSRASLRKTSQED